MLMVNDQAITVAEVLYALRDDMAEARAAQTPRGFIEWARGAIRDHVRREIGSLLVYQEATAGFADPQRESLDKYVEQRLTERVGQEFGGSVARLETHLAEHGLTLDVYREWLRRDVIVGQYSREKFLPRITIRRDELMAYWRRTRDARKTASRRELYMIEAPFDKFLEPGQSWADAGAEAQAQARLRAARHIRAAHAALAEPASPDASGPQGAGASASEPMTEASPSESATGTVQPESATGTLQPESATGTLQPESMTEASPPDSATGILQPESMTRASPPESAAAASAAAQSAAAQSAAAQSAAQPQSAALSATFERVAREYSRGLKADEGGCWGYVTRPLRAPYDGPTGRIFEFAAGQTSEPIEMADGWVIVHCGRVEQEKLPSFDEAQADLRRQIETRRLNELMTDYMIRLASRATITSLDAFVDSAVRRLARQPNLSAAGRGNRILP
jgi:hypothetical protein